MIFILKKVILLLFLKIFLASCASVSSLQTARVLKPQQVEHTISFAYYSSDDFIEDEVIEVPLLEYQYRRGFSDQMDLGFKVSLVGSIGADIKYSLFQTERFAISTGFGLGGFWNENDRNGSDSYSSIVDLMVPIYVSYDFSSYLSIYGAGKYIYRFLSTDARVLGEWSLIVGSLGFKYGETSGVTVEASYVSGQNLEFSGLQYNIGFFYTI